MSFVHREATYRAVALKPGTVKSDYVFAVAAYAGVVERRTKSPPALPGTGSTPKPGVVAHVLELRYSRLWEINGAKTQGIIITRRVIEGFSQTKRKGQKHNPSLTQRVAIVANAQLQGASARDFCARPRSLADASGLIPGTYFGTVPGFTTSECACHFLRAIGLKSAPLALLRLTPKISPLRTLIAAVRGRRLRLLTGQFTSCHVIAQQQIHQRITVKIP